MENKRIFSLINNMVQLKRYYGSATGSNAWEGLCGVMGASSSRLRNLMEALGHHLDLGGTGII
jgi:hypothetical protein